MNETHSSPDQVLQQALHDADLQWALLDQLEEGLYIVDRQRRILYWNSGAERITGYKAMAVTGRLCPEGLLMHCDADGKGLCGAGCPLVAVMADGKPRECLVYLRHKQGHRLPVRVRSRPVHGPEGTILGAVEVFESTSPPRAHIAHIESFGCCDELTGIANRAYGELRATHALDALAKFGLPFGWLGIALDHTAELEQRNGHGFIDAAVRVLARTLDQVMGPLDILVRWSRTEFRVLIRRGEHYDLLDTGRRAVVLSHCSDVAWWGDTAKVTVSAGAALAQRGDSIQSLESRAAEAVAASQAAGGNRAALKHPNAVEFAAVNPLEII
jgi:diguanylate cyclase (GGDEF)-like protein/PAS domain S-box-containing protein